MTLRDNTLFQTEIYKSHKVESTEKRLYSIRMDIIRKYQDMTAKYKQHKFYVCFVSSCIGTKEPVTIINSGFICVFSGKHTS